MITRRSSLKKLGAMGAMGMLAEPAARLRAGDNSSPPLLASGAQARQAIFDRVFKAPLVDTHEHLIDEAERLRGTAHPKVGCDDWAFLMSHYLDSDLLNAGMPPQAMARFSGSGMDPIAKWQLIEPYWPYVRHTGYGQAVAITLRELYGVEELNGTSVRQVQAEYEKTRRPGFYRRILCEKAGIESCQVNCLTGEPFKESSQPVLLMQDLSIVGMFSGPGLQTYARPAGINVQSLADWHRVIDWWFTRYGPFAVAVKSQQAYGRDIDYQRVPAEQAAPVFEQVLNKKSISNEQRKLLEDHLFWKAADGAAAAGLPVKLHTGYYAGRNSMPLDRLLHNPGSAASLCRLAPSTQFVFMHICYPYYEEMIALAKQWANAYIDMCWAWIINPIAAKDFLKKFIVTAPLNKVLTFGGDYIPVEPVLGHALMARRGIALALSELVEEGWLTLADALSSVNPLTHGNARQLFKLAEKSARLEKVPWAMGANPGGR